MLKTSKKILSIIMVVIMVLTAVPLSGFVGLELPAFDLGIRASAKTVASSGWCGPNVTYTYDSATKKLVISGTGAMYDYYDYYQNHYHHSSIFYNSDIKSIVIEDGVTSIGEYAFHYCRSLTSITIPDSIEIIGNYAFYDCISLKNITIPNSVTTIGDYVFSGCTSLSTITIPDSVTLIGCDVFYNTAYYNNTANWKNDVLYIGNHLIKANTSILGDYTIKNDTLTIAPFAFSDCDNLSSITIPDSIIIIGNYAFKNCNNLISVTIPDSVSIISEGTFQYCSKLINIIIPNSVISIDSYAFSDCTHLETINLPDSVMYIGADILKNTAWFNYKSKGIITIDGWIYGYKGTESNVTVNIDKAIKGIAYSTFRSNYNIIEYVVESDNLYYSSENGVLFNKDKSILIEYPCGKMDISSYVIPNTVKEIKDYAFYDCKYIHDLTISNNVETIDPTAFGNCKLTVLNIDIKTIPDRLFSNCSNLNTLILGNNVEVIGDYAFEQCNSLRNITVGCGIKTIGIAAFDYEKSYKRSVYINDLETWCNIEFLSESSNPMYNFWVSYADAYYSSSSCLYINGVEATNITIPNTITKIKPYAFYMCRSIKNITIPDGVTSIGDRAFAICVGLTSVVLPDSVEIIGSDAFCVCENITNITLGKNLKSIGSYAFNKCTSLKDVFYPGSQEDWDKVIIGYYNDYLTNADLFLLHKHNYTITVTTQPTCTTEGSALYECSLGDTKTEILPALGHMWDEGKFTSNSTCNFGGTKIYTCTVCFSTKTETIDTLEHNYQLISAYGPTCTKDGYEVYRCTYCGITENRTTAPMLGHDFESEFTVDIDSTCTKTGIKSKHCTRCNETADETVIPLKDHAWQIEPTVIKIPACTAEGESVVLCRDCKIVKDGSSKAISALGHDFEYIIVVSPTCKTQGYEVGNCSRCDATDTRLVAIIDHDYVRTEISPTCLEDGVATYTCSYGCGETYDETLPALGHSYPDNWVIILPATCTERGSSIKVCQTCSEIMSQILPKLSHSDSNSDGVCDECGFGDDSEPDTPPQPEVHEHSYTATISKYPSCTEKGVKRFVCACGNSYNEDIAAVGHKDADGNGLCDVCGFGEEIKPDVPENPSANCSCNCHKGGLSKIIFNLILFFQKLLRSNKTCSCGVSHY